MSMEQPFDHISRALERAQSEQAQRARLGSADVGCAGRSS